MGLELWHGKEVPGSESLRKGLGLLRSPTLEMPDHQTAEVNNVFGGGGDGRGKEKSG